LGNYFKSQSTYSNTFKYKNSKFPIRLKPLKNELLSSWLIRVAYAHYMNPPAFISLYFDNFDRQIFHRDIDLIGINENFIKQLVFKTYYKKEDFLGMTLKSYEGYLFINLNKSNRNLFVLQPRFKKGRAIKKAIRFCPLCLKESIEQHLKKQWRLSFSTICLKHKCFLHDNCPECGEVFSPNKRKYDINEYHCHKCGFSFSNSTIKYVSKSSSGFKNIQKINEILESGVFIFEGKPILSIFFFPILKQILRFLYFYNYRKIKIFEKESNLLKIKLPFKKNEKKRFIEDLSIKEHYILFTVAMEILKEKSSLEKYIKDNNIGASFLNRGLDYIPFWYDELIKPFNEKYYFPTNEEIKSAVKHLKKNGIKPSYKKLSKIFDCYLDKRRTIKIK